MRQLMMKYVGSGIEISDGKGYTIRPYVSEDYEEMLTALIPLTIKRYTAEELDSVILKKNGVMPDSVFVAEDAGHIIGTATGYFHLPDAEKNGDNGGTLHMVSALPEASGRAVGFNICSAVVNYLIERGCEYVDLTTDDFRLPAIVTYCRIGFRPVIDDEEMQQRWSALAEKLALPELIEEAYRV